MGIILATITSKSFALIKYASGDNTITCIGEGVFFIQPADSNANSFFETLSQTHPEKCFTNYLSTS